MATNALMGLLVKLPPPFTSTMLSIGQKEDLDLNLFIEDIIKENFTT